MFQKLNQLSEEYNDRELAKLDKTINFWRSKQLELYNLNSIKLLISEEICTSWNYLNLIELSEWELLHISRLINSQFVFQTSSAAIGKLIKITRANSCLPL